MLMVACRAAADDIFMIDSSWSEFFKSKMAKTMGQMLIIMLSEVFSFVQPASLNPKTLYLLS